MYRGKIVIFVYRCQVLMVTGSKASFNHTVHRLYGHMQQKMDKKRVELLEVEGVANVIEEKVQVLTIYIQRRITLVVIQHYMIYQTVNVGT